MPYSANWQTFGEHWIAPAGLGWFMGLGALVFTILIAWSIYWKGMSLWKAARNGHKVWFVVLLIVNTIGILEILYIYVFSKKMKSGQ